MTIPKQLLEAKVCNKNTCELQDRIDKAIEYIEWLKNNDFFKERWNTYDTKHLLDILKGSDTNVKD